MDSSLMGFRLLSFLYLIVCIELVLFCSLLGKMSLAGFNKPTVLHANVKSPSPLGELSLPVFSAKALLNREKQLLLSPPCSLGRKDVPSLL